MQLITLENRSAQGRHLHVPWCWGEGERLGGPAKRVDAVEEETGSVIYTLCSSHAGRFGLVWQMTGNPLTAFRWVTSSDRQRRKHWWEYGGGRQAGPLWVSRKEEEKGTREACWQRTDTPPHRPEKEHLPSGLTLVKHLRNGSHWFLCFKTTGTSHSVLPNRKRGQVQEQNCQSDFKSFLFLFYAWT